MLNLSIGLLLSMLVLAKCQCPISYELNVDFKGNDLFPYPIFVPTVDLCCNGCSNYPTCMAWTYVPGNQACWLKNSSVVQRTISNGRKKSISLLL